MPVPVAIALLVLAALGVIGALFNEGVRELPSDLDQPHDNT